MIVASVAPALRLAHPSASHAGRERLSSAPVATKEEVQAAVERLAARIDGSDAKPGAIPERSIVCVLPDLKTAIGGRFKDARLIDIGEMPDTDADVRLTAKSDDLVALIDGRLGVAFAFLTGKVRIDASPEDLMLIRKLF
jgi:hypothetical protein